ncbi:hypothetical protein BOO86_02810 [Mycobacterium sp. CBMA 234]|uniref:ESX-1 secretion-associated protein n=1 Tax=Mycolicibacterium sp. CBMA 234 TaxID=1918495 RepID=UPI0012DE2002|nr:ESX-1 secretion-associated protein [Mycolicibacterium sp. CBMA 234]MUL63384.1 hypothetical protein [Mycolicibacterium sp. CBMA 234]
MTEPLRVQPEGLLNYSQLHGDVSTGMSGLFGAGAPDGKGVDTSHGAVSSEVSTALASALEGRGDAFGAVSDTADKFSERLQRAAKAYSDGDQHAADRIKRAMGAIDGQGADGGQMGGRPAGGPAGGAPGSPAGGEMMGQMGQMLGQVGQQVGQLAQSITQPLQGLTQGLQQIPQQIMQAAQQASQATSAGGSGQGKDAKEHESERGSRDTNDAARKKPEREDGKGADRPQMPQGQAAQGNATGSSRAPVQPIAPSVRPAPTRAPAD